MHCRYDHATSLWSIAKLTNCLPPAAMSVHSPQALSALVPPSVRLNLESPCFLIAHRARRLGSQVFPRIFALLYLYQQEGNIRLSFLQR